MSGENGTMSHISVFLGGPVPPLYPGFPVCVRPSVRACVRAEFRVRKVVEADLTMMMKTKVIRYDELTPKTHGLPTLDPTWAK